MPKEKLPDIARLALCDNIRKCRLKAYPGRSSSSRCAKAFGVTLAQWSHWESGRRTPDRTSREKIANFFGVTMDELMIPTYTEGALGSGGELELLAQMSGRQPGNPGDGATHPLFSPNFINMIAAQVAERMAPQFTARLLAQLTPVVAEKIAPAIIDEVMHTLERLTDGLAITLVKSSNGSVIRRDARKIRMPIPMQTPMQASMQAPMLPPE